MNNRKKFVSNFSQDWLMGWFVNKTGQIPKQGSLQIWIKLTLTYSQLIV